MCCPECILFSPVGDVGSGSGGRIGANAIRPLRRCSDDVQSPVNHYLLGFHGFGQLEVMLGDWHQLSQPCRKMQNREKALISVPVVSGNLIAFRPALITYNKLVIIPHYSDSVQSAHNYLPSIISKLFNYYNLSAIRIHYNCRLSEIHKWL